MCMQSNIGVYVTQSLACQWSTLVVYATNSGLPVKYTSGFRHKVWFARERMEVLLIKFGTILLDEMPVYRNKMYTNLNPTIKIWVWEAICGDKK